jgi:hypothetical protein
MFSQEALDEIFLEEYRQSPTCVLIATCMSQSGGSCRLHFPKSQPLAELMALNLWGNQGPPPDGGGGAFPPFRHCTRVAISCTVLRPLLTGSLLEHTFVNRRLFEHPTWVCSDAGFLHP